MKKSIEELMKEMDQKLPKWIEDVEKRSKEQNKKIYSLFKSLFFIFSSLGDDFPPLQEVLTVCCNKILYFLKQQDKGLYEKYVDGFCDEAIFLLCLKVYFHLIIYPMGLYEISPDSREKYYLRIKELTKHIEENKNKTKNSDYPEWVKKFNKAQNIDIISANNFILKIPDGRFPIFAVPKELCVILGVLSNKDEDLLNLHLEQYVGMHIGWLSKALFIETKSVDPIYYGLMHFRSDSFI